MWQKMQEYGLIIVGGFVYSLGLNLFLVANHLAEGGFIGISVLLLYKLNIPISISFLVLNIPLLLLAWRQFGHQFVWKTTLGVVSVSLFTELTSHLTVVTHDKLLAALYAGVITGIGLGLIFRVGGTTGGADIIARMMRQYRGIAMGKTMFAIDVLVIVLVGWLVGYVIAMYSLVALFVSSRVIDFVIEGLSRSKALHVISSEYEQIIDAIHEHLGRGTTLLQAQGGYTGQIRPVVYCVVSRDEVLRVQRIVANIDPTAFVIVNDVHEVLGEGFSYDSPPIKHPVE
ncbi:MAG: YitT family protein [Alicyclobacillaceae bacterium]|uniref:YitT family protein n=1 Tax=Alicyclobacillus sp. SP_1 TaxID=2942475 RepID=UPI0021572C1A|nr:YitT family protein [Alicyclobacillus sp. SP_1]MCY0888189.1 YitT family protein [Alicyclobacillaceae bacterium]MCY0896455.1 YitT family protein [Alicyclobacillaceae bacterium]